MNTKEEALFIFILFLFCLTLFFFGLGAVPLWEPDEGIHAASSKEIVLSGDWITPKFNGENFYDKPILHNWFVAISFLVLGFTEFAARLPAAILGLGGVVITYLLGRRMFGPWAGILSGVILATSPEYVVLSRTVVHDICLAFFVLLALFSFYAGFKNERHRKRYFTLFYISLGFAVLAKGPVGVLLPALIVGLFLFLQRKLSFLKEMGIGWGILIFLAVAAPWYILISMKNKDYGGYFFIQQNLMNFLSSEARHHGPFYYYLPALFAGFFPWSFFLPLAFYRAVLRGVKKIGEDHLFLLVWFFVIFIFFSLASSKLTTYILPLFPAASLLVGKLWNDLIETLTPELRRGFLYSFIGLMGVVILGMVVIGLNPPSNFKEDYGLDLMSFKWYGAAFAVAIVVPFWLYLSQHLKASFLTLIGAVLAMFLFMFLVIIPIMNPYRSTKGLAQKLDRMIAPEEKILFFRILRTSALFYTNRKAIVLRTPKELKNVLRLNERVFCIIRRSFFEKDEELRRMAYIIDEEGHKVLISNRK